MQRKETQKYLLSNDIRFQHSVDEGKRRFFVSVCSGCGAGEPLYLLKLIVVYYIISCVRVTIR